MRKCPLKISLVILIFLLTVLLACGCWLVGTSGGARWLLKSLAKAGSTSFSTTSVSGSLAGELKLSGLRIALQEGALAVEELSLNWNPMRLLQGRAEIENLSVKGFHLGLEMKQTAQAEKEDSAESRKMKALSRYVPHWLAVDVKRLQVNDFRLSQGEVELFSFQSLSLVASLREHLLTLQPLSWHSPYVELNGEARLQMKTMVLELQTDVTLPDQMVSHELLTNIAIPPSFRARLKVQGDIFNYQGDIRVGSPDIPSLRLESKVSGNLKGLSLEKLYGYWLQGSVQGNLLLAWEKTFFIQGELFARELDPALIDSQWPGTINLDVRGRFEAPPEKASHTTFALVLHPSTIRSQPVSGAAAGEWGNSGLLLEDLTLEGKGLQIKASGAVSDRLDFQLKAESLDNWLAEAQGRIEADGWLRWHERYLTGTAQGRWEDLSLEEISASRGQFSASHLQQDGSVDMVFSARRIGYGNLLFQSARLEAQGTLKNHRASLALGTDADPASLKARVSGSYQDNSWKGRLQQLAARDQKLGLWNLRRFVDISMGGEKIIMTPLILQADRGGTLRLTGNYEKHNSSGYLEGHWSQLSLSLLDPWLVSGKLRGQSNGKVSVRWREGVPSIFKLHSRTAGGADFGSHSFSIEKLAVDSSWNEKGLEGLITANLGEHGQLEITASSQQPAAWSVPRELQLATDLQAFNLDVLKAFYPQGVALNGHLFASIQGRWLGDQRFTLRGKARIEEGSMGWRSSQPLGSQVLAKIGNGTLDWDWTKDGLRWNAALILDKNGRLEIEGNLPLSPQWPIEIREKDPIKGKIVADMQEKGLLTTLMPDLIRESRGDIKADIDLAGTWRRPLLRGELRVDKMGGYIPTTGIELRDIALTTIFQGQEASISELQIFSGSGSIQGTGLVTFPEFTDVNYRLELTGKNFQLANLPEARVLGNPDLLIEGGINNLSLSGKIFLPEFLVSGTGKKPEVQPSRDLVIVSAQPAEAQPSSDFDMNIRVKVILGKKAFVEATGLHARLEGDVLLFQKDGDQLGAEGRIRVADGSYTAYGANLNVRRGHINFTGGPVDSPSLDILALREIGKVQAGVQVTGTAEAPDVNLYSNPAMPEKDIIGYIFLGRPMRSDQQEADLLSLGVGAMLPQGQGPGFFRRLGFTDIDLSGLLDEGGVVRLRYRLRDNLEVESTFGGTNGVDLYHVIEFN